MTWKIVEILSSQLLLWWKISLALKFQLNVQDKSSETTELTKVNDATTSGNEIESRL